MDIPYFLMTKETKKENEMGPKKLMTGILFFGTAIGLVLGLGIKKIKVKRWKNKDKRCLFQCWHSMGGLLKNPLKNKRLRKLRNDVAVHWIVGHYQNLQAGSKMIPPVFVSISYRNRWQRWCVNWMDDDYLETAETNIIPPFLNFRPVSQVCWRHNLSECLIFRNIRCPRSNRSFPRWGHNSYSWFHHDF